MSDAVRELRKYKVMAERATAQVPDARWFERIDPDSNSLAIVMKHMAGNLRSRWTDFLTTDGEKADRHRDTEFEELDDTPDTIRARWEEGWARLFEALEPLGDEDVTRSVTIRGEQHTVQQAVQRQLTHYAYHVGQIVFLAKHLAGADFETLSIARGKSSEFGAAHGTKSYLGGQS